MGAVKKMREEQNIMLPNYTVTITEEHVCLKKPIPCPNTDCPLRERRSRGAYNQ